ncbi:hypothetical protein GCM10023191_098380 [Actinoallomurus oryzae]|uniref:Uncharacterized protein n=1 Tax=Actinoallomurus oryzae TaxID=502180 RepID=A0ABP8R8L8_9ACTN
MRGDGADRGPVRVARTCTGGRGRRGGGVDGRQLRRCCDDAPWGCWLSVYLDVQSVRVAERVQVREIDEDEGGRLLRIIRRGTGSVVTWRRAQMVLLSAVA